MIVVRPAVSSDLSSIYKLACSMAGQGMTTLPADLDAIQRKLGASEASFGTPVGEIRPADLSSHQYVFIATDSENAESGIAGISAIYPSVEQHFMSGLISPRTADLRDQKLIFAPVLGGLTEIGSLVVAEPYRNVTESGKLLSRSRFAFMAAAPSRFRQTVFTELRGAVNAQGRSICGEWLSQRLFGCSMAEADSMLALKGHDQIYGTMSMPVIAARDIPAAVRQNLGVAHMLSARAQRILEKYEDMRYEGFFDAAQGGPQLTGIISHTSTVSGMNAIASASRSPAYRNMLTLKMTVNDLPGTMPTTIVTNAKDGTAFRSVCCQFAESAAGVVISKAAAHALELEVGAPLSYVPLLAGHPLLQAA